MAEDIVLSVGVDASGQGAKSLASLKKDFKDLQTELSNTQVGTDAYLKTLQKLGAVKDEMGDLRDTINALNPEGKVAAFSNVAGKLASGFQAATGAAALLGVESEDLQKTLLKVQAATAFAEGIRSLSGLGDAFAVVGTVIKSQVITSLTTLKGALLATGIGAFAVAIGVLIAKTQEYNEAIDDEFNKQEKLNKSLKETTDEYLKQATASENLRNARKGGLNQLERELKLLEATGTSADEVFEKRKAIADAEIFNMKVRREGLADDQRAWIEASEKILDKENEKAVLIIANDKRIADERKKLSEEYLARIKKEQDEKKRLADEDEKLFREVIDAQNKILEDDAAIQREEKQTEKDQQDAEYKADAEATSARVRAAHAEYKENKEEEKRIARETEAAKVAATNQGLLAAKTLSEAYFAFQLGKAKGNAAETGKLLKRQFDVEKAFNVARVSIDGTRSVIAALTIPGPTGIALAAANGIIAAAAIAKILATQFSGVTGSAPDTSVNLPTANIQTTTPTISQPGTTLGPQGQNLNQPQPMIRAFVTEEDITNSQGRVRRLADQAKF